MARRGLRPISVGRGKRRSSTWVGPADQNYISVASNTKVIIASFDAAINGLTSPTVVRTRGMVSVKPTNTGASLNYGGAFGVAIVTDRAFAAGAASVPGPFTDSGWDGWFVLGFFQHNWLFPGTSTSEVYSDVDVQVDSKAMRKITDDETLILVCESQVGALDVAMHLRFLFKLS